jgi:hypothetical protein
VTGWASDRQGGNYAVQTVISNAMGTDGSWLEEAAPLFQAFMREASGTDDVTFTQPIGKPVEVDD